MGTRNLVCVVKGGEYKIAQYGQWDGYPSGNGVEVLRFLKWADLDKFSEQLDRLSWITDAEIKDAWITCGAKPDDNWVDMEVSDRFRQLFPHLSRDTGAGILKIVHDMRSPLKLKNSISFASDSVFCEYAYVIDMDHGTLEVFEGFNRDALAESERFHDMPLEEPSEVDGKQFYPICHRATFLLSELPTEEEFLKELEDQDELEDEGA